MQSQRGVTYTATAIGPLGAPILGLADGPRTADIHGQLVQPRLKEHATARRGTTLPVTLTTTRNGPAWHVTGGPFTGYLVPYHSPAWSVNPAGSRPKIRP